ncbi:lipopolysaccharide biosynthesis protein [Rubrolithibacter danxiaensis]|uniref:lipopolysaccharide biosynthesis protein n=1 Tax=Rubrolithibacter danxiaensis TaxID=3390805 RepID=UPI003BF7B3AC
MKQFLKIYLWQVISLLSGFATMFVVTPFLASNQNYFGIYSFVVSLNLFLSYADFGFLTAGVKFASEAYARNDREEEEKVLGFVFFIMFLVFCLFGLLILFLAFNPQHILKGLSTTTDLNLAKNLFLVFVFSLPVLIAHRSLQLIFNIRLHDYLYQRVFSLLNLLKILMAFYFFRNGGYHIVEYYLFTQVITLVSVLIGGILAIKYFGYNFIALIKAVKFSPEIYSKSKKLAFNSLFVTISWILYYEMDSLVIGKFVGLKEVAIFNICISVMMLSRSLYSIIYNPFTAKFNHFIGRDEMNKFTLAYNKILMIGLPFSVIPTTVLILTMKSFIYTWVGVSYRSSIPIITIMFASYYYTFLSNPTSIAMVAMQRIRGLYLSSALLPLIYWIGIASTFNYLNLMAFGLFKFLAITVSATLYFYYSQKMFFINWKRFFSRSILPSLATIVILIFFNFIFKENLPTTKGRLELLQYLGFVLLYFIIGIMSYYLLSKDFRKLVKEIYIELFYSLMPSRNHKKEKFID